MSGAAPVALHIALLVALPPLLPGVIGKVKALVAGRRGPPVWQLYADILKLLRKGAVYGHPTTWVFRAGPVVALAATASAGLIVPLHARAGPLAFPGDVIAFAALLGLGRFFTMAAALDTASSFEGMGASREAAFAALSEPAVLLGLAAAIRTTGEYSLTGITAAAGSGAWKASSPALLLVVVSLLAVFLAENSRIPVDDPNTHLELTMIHEVMILDHSGPDLALLEYGAALKLWVFGGLIVGLVVPARADSPTLNLAAFLAGMLVLAVLVGALESSLARLRLLRVPQFLVGAAAASALALVLVLR